MNTEGLFRTPGDVKVAEELLAKLSEHHDLIVEDGLSSTKTWADCFPSSPSDSDIHVVTRVITTWLRSFPDSLTTSARYGAWLELANWSPKSTAYSGDDEGHLSILVAMRALVDSLPAISKNNLLVLTRFLLDASSHSGKNRMNITALATCIAPCLYPTRQSTGASMNDLTQLAQDSQLAIALTQKLITHADFIFEPMACRAPLLSSEAAWWLRATSATDPIPHPWVPSMSEQELLDASQGPLSLFTTLLIGFFDQALPQGLLEELVQVTADSDPAHMPCLPLLQAWFHSKMVDSRLAHCNERTWIDSSFATVINTPDRAIGACDLIVDLSLNASNTPTRLARLLAYLDNSAGDSGQSVVATVLVQSIILPILSSPLSWRLVDAPLTDEQVTCIDPIKDAIASTAPNLSTALPALLSSDTVLDLLTGQIIDLTATILSSMTARGLRPLPPPTHSPRSLQDLFRASTSPAATSSRPVVPPLATPSGAMLRVKSETFDALALSWVPEPSPRGGSEASLPTSPIAVRRPTSVKVTAASRKRKQTAFARMEASNSTLIGEMQSELEAERAKSKALQEALETVKSPTASSSSQLVQEPEALSSTQTQAPPPSASVSTSTTKLQQQQFDSLHANAVIDALRSQVGALERQVEALQHNPASRRTTSATEATIDDLRRQVVALTTANEELMHRLATKQSQAAALRMNNAELETELATVRGQLAAKDNENEKRATEARIQELEKRVNTQDEALKTAHVIAAEHTKQLAAANVALQKRTESSVGKKELVAVRTELLEARTMILHLQQAGARSSITEQEHDKDLSVVTRPRSGSNASTSSRRTSQCRPRTTSRASVNPPGRTTAVSDAVKRFEVLANDFRSKFVDQSSSSNRRSSRWSTAASGQGNRRRTSGFSTLESAQSDLVVVQNRANELSRRNQLLLDNLRAASPSPEVPEVEVHNASFQPYDSPARSRASSYSSRRH